MEILAPQYIWLLTVIPFVAVGAYIALLRRIKRLNLVSQNKRSVLSEWKRIVVPTLVSALLILSFLRPYRGYEDISQNGNGRDNLILIDVSRSMLTRDASPTRLEIAKRKVLDLISIIRENHTLDRIGIILFAGRAYLYCPPTQDLGAVKEFTAHISTELITAQGSGINEALITAASVIKRTNMLQPRLFIFSDGEDLGFKATEAATILKSSELRPLIIGIGTEAGSPIDLGREGFVKDNSGKIVISKLARDVLQNLAEAADGSYASFSVGTQDLRKLLGDHSLQDLNQQSVSNKANVRIYNEYGHIFLWLALALVSLSLIFRKTLPLFLFLSCFLLNSTSAIAQSETPSLRESWKLYNEGKFAEAASGFAQGYSLNPDSLDIAQALGSSLYKQGKFKEATKYFSQIASTAKSGQDLFNGHYNLGNSYLLQNENDKAITEYETALKIKPDDDAAKFNLELAKKQKEEQQKKDENKDQDKKDQKEEKQDQKNQNQKKQDQSESEKNQQGQRSKDEKNSNPESTPNPESGEQQPQDKDESSNDKKQNSQNENSNETPPEESDESTTAIAATPLPEEEARQWLDSLPDAPLLIQRKYDRNLSTNGQTW